MPYFSARLDFPSPPLSAPGSPRMPRSKKRLQKSKHPLNGGSDIFLFELIGINRGMIQKVGQNLSPKSNKSDIDDRSADESHITLRGERDVICLRNPTKDNRAFRRMLTSADQYCKKRSGLLCCLYILAQIMFFYIKPFFR